jgi:DNA-binding HxlR family transcriptional regulator
METPSMRNYGQYCPVARGAEIFAERWTPIIMRNILYGCRTFNDIAAGAPGLSRALLIRRLRELEHASLVEIHSKPGGHGSIYEPTAAGRALEPVLTALGVWADQWTDVRPEHSDSGIVLWSWCQVYLRRESLPQGRIVVRFDFQTLGRPKTSWFLIDGGKAELCAFDPGFGDDLIVTINDPLTFARWHLGHLPWTTALGSGAVTVVGPRDLRRGLPTWNRRPDIGVRLRAAHRGAAPRSSSEVPAAYR